MIKRLQTVNAVLLIKNNISVNIDRFIELSL